MDAINTLGARAIRDAIASREVSAVEIVDATFERIEALEERIHAFNQLTPYLARDAAARIDELVAAGESLPPLAGVPVGIKDNMINAGTEWEDDQEYRDEQIVWGREVEDIQDYCRELVGG